MYPATRRVRVGMRSDDRGEDSLTFIGTATTLLELGPFTLLTDPNFQHQGQWTYFGQGIVSQRRTEPSMQPRELPPLDAVVLSHLHGDHFDRIARRELSKEMPILTTEQAARQLAKTGFRNPVGLPTWSSETLTRDDAKLTVTAVPARHARGPVNALLPPVMGSMVEYVRAADAAPLRIYISGDTIMHGGLEAIRERYPAIDFAVVHLGGTKVLGVLLTMDGKQGVDLLELLKPARTFPVHYDDYGRFHSPISNFLVEVADRNPPSEVYFLQRGETLPLTPTLDWPAP